MENKYLSAALHFAQDLGWSVFPVSEITKKPYTPHGCKDAKRDPQAIKAWWSRHPNASVGVATGAPSNLLVIDLDIDENKGLDGMRELREWEHEHGELPDTVSAITGRGGSHLYYKYDGSEKYGNRTGILDGVDIRGDGGYVIAPPSLHPNGTEYQWENDPDEVPMSEITETVKEFLKIGKAAAGETFRLPDKIGAGKRNDTIYRLACSMQAKGVSDETIFTACASENAARCTPPLEEMEVKRLVESALKYQKGIAQAITEAEGRPRLKLMTDRNGELTDKPIQSIANAAEAIEYDKKLVGHLFYNEMTFSPYVFGDLPWCKCRGWREWNNTDDTNLKSYIEDEYGLKNGDKTMDALNNVVHKHLANPVKEMLERAHEAWDGNKHIENLLPRFVGTEKTDYNTAVIRLFMMGAVSRIYKPGCKFDYMMVLVGEQGKFKSSFLRLLATNDMWCHDNFNSLEGDKAFEKLRGKWIVELAELQATKRAKDVESIKAFITSTTDTYRAPYARRSEDHPRMCVLAGTSNPVDFLTDRTGNRRFLPVTCGVHETENPLENIEASRAEILQAWGEVMDEYMRAGGDIPLVLSKEQAETAKRIQEGYLEEDPDIGLIQEWLGKHEGDVVCAVQLWKEALGREYERYGRKEINAIHEIMKNNITGWEAVGKIRCDNYGVQRAYRRISQKVVDTNTREGWERAPDHSPFDS